MREREKREAELLVMAHFVKFSEGSIWPALTRPNCSEEEEEEDWCWKFECSLTFPIDLVEHKPKAIFEFLFTHSLQNLSNNIALETQCITRSLSSCEKCVQEYIRFKWSRIKHIYHDTKVTISLERICISFSHMLRKNQM